MTVPVYTASGIAQMSLLASCYLCNRHEVVKWLNSLIRIMLGLYINSALCIVLMDGASLWMTPYSWRWGMRHRTPHTSLILLLYSEPMNIVAAYRMALRLKPKSQEAALPLTSSPLPCSQSFGNFGEVHVTLCSNSSASLWQVYL